MSRRSFVTKFKPRVGMRVESEDKKHFTAAEDVLEVVTNNMSAMG